MTDPLTEITEIQEQLTELQNRTIYLTNQRNTLIRATYQSGRTIAELSRATGVSRNTIYKIVQTRKS